MLLVSSFWFLAFDQPVLSVAKCSGQGFWFTDPPSRDPGGGEWGNLTAEQALSLVEGTQSAEQ